ncbi:hypothetical protein Q5752_001167 [Cryptotrichosporon argae]
MSLRSLVPVSRTLQAARPFSTSAPVCESRARVVARQKRNKVLAQRAAAASASAANRADPVLGSVPPAARSYNASPSTSASASAPRDLWPGCRLQRVLLSASEVWYSPPPNYSAGEAPMHFLPGINAADRALLFGAVPHATAALAFDAEDPTASAEAAVDQARQAEALMRALDLHNASKRGIEVVNRQRIVDEFGAKTASGGKDTGSSAVQAALLTHKIRSLHAHLESNVRDTQNRRALRLLVHERARVLAYARRRDGEQKYVALLGDLGLERSAVEGEISGL